MATSTLEEKINKIRQQNEEIRRRHEEVEADKKSAAELNALVQMVPSSDWPERKEPPEFVDPPQRNNHKPKPSTREHRGSQQQYHPGAGDRKRIHVFAEGDGPPPDPSYNFLADSEREERVKVDGRESERGRGRGGPPRGASRKRGTERDVPMKQDHRGSHPGSRDAPDYEAWRAERNRIDEARINRQRTAEGNWRREWDNDKVNVDEETPASMTSARPTIGDVIRRDHKEFDRRHQFDVAEHGAPRGRSGNFRSPRGTPRGSHNGRGYQHSTSLDQFYGPLSPGHKSGQNTGLPTNVAAPLSPTGSDDRTVFTTDKSIKVTLNHGAAIVKGPVMSVKVSSPSIAGTGRVGPRQKSRLLYSSQSEAEIASQDPEDFLPQKSIDDKPSNGRFNRDNNGQQRRVAQSPHLPLKKEGSQKMPYSQRKELKNEASAPMSPQRRGEREPKSPYLHRRELKNDAPTPMSSQWREHEPKFWYPQRELKIDASASLSAQRRDEREPKSPYLQEKELKNDTPAPMSPQRRRDHGQKSPYPQKKEFKNDTIAPMSPQRRGEHEPKSPHPQRRDASQKSPYPQRKSNFTDSHQQRRVGDDSAKTPLPQRQLSEKSKSDPRKSAQIQRAEAKEPEIRRNEGQNNVHQISSKKTKDAEWNDDGTKVESGENDKDSSGQMTKEDCNINEEGKLTDAPSEEPPGKYDNEQQNLSIDTDRKSSIEDLEILQDSDMENDNDNGIVAKSSINLNNEISATGTVGANEHHSSELIVITKGEETDIVSEKAEGKDLEMETISEALTKDATESSNDKTCDNNELEISNDTLDRSNDSQDSKFIEKTVTKVDENDKKFLELTNDKSDTSNYSQDYKVVEETVSKVDENDRKLPEQSLSSGTEDSRRVAINDQIVNVDDSDVSKGTAMEETHVQTKTKEKAADDENVNHAITGTVNADNDSHAESAEMKKNVIIIDDLSENQRNENAQNESIAMNGSTVSNHSTSLPKNFSEKSANGDTSFDEDNVGNINENGQT